MREQGKTDWFRCRVAGWKVGWLVMPALLLGLGMSGWSAPALTIPTATVPENTHVWLPVLLTGQVTGTPVCSVRFTIEVLGGQILDWEPGTAAAASGRGVACRITGQSCQCVVYGSSDGLPEGDLIRILLRSETSAATLTISGVEGADPTAVFKAVSGGGFTPVQWGGSYIPHKADLNGDWRVSLSELLRVIQIYNLGGYSCRADSEDGYWPEPGGEQTCAPHDADYAPQDWQITLNEVLRIVQFFNSGGYGRRSGSEDGFMAGGFWF